MSDLVLLPDAEQLVSNFLQAQDEIQAIAGTDPVRVYTVIPAKSVFPLMRITRYGGQPASAYPLWVDKPQLQLEAFGGPKATAHDLLATAVATITARLPGTTDLGVVDHLLFGQFRYLPDDTFTPPKPRYLTTCTITLHPLPA